MGRVRGVLAGLVLTSVAVGAAVVTDGRGVEPPGAPMGASATPTASGGTGAAGARDVVPAPGTGAVTATESMRSAPRSSGPAGTRSGGSGAGGAGSGGAGLDGSKGAGAGAVTGDADSAAGAAPDASALRRVDARTERVRALRALLDARRQAVLSQDPDRWLRTVDRASPVFRNRQAAVFRNLRQVPFADWSYRYVGAAPALPAARARQLGGRAWVARVLVGHRLRGFDTATSYSEQFLTVVHRRSGWVLAADSDGVGAPQPWDLGPVGVARGSRVLVLGTASAAELRGYAVDGDRAVAQVTTVWGTRWPRRAVLVVPRTQADFGRLLLRNGTGLGQVAAVTIGDLPDASEQPAEDAGPGTSRLRRNDRVVLNPSAFDRLGPTGRRVVLAHEVTHVAARSSTTAAVPIWLSEGLADYVAYKGSGVALRTSAGDVLAEVRRGRAPTSLPKDADFDPARTRIAPAYAASLVASHLVVLRYGERGLVRLYRAAATRYGDAGPDARLARALPRTLGLSAAQFTAEWRRFLVRLAG